MAQNPSTNDVTGRTGFETFRSKAEKDWYREKFSSTRAIAIERPMKLADFPNKVRRYFQKFHWEAHLEKEGDVNEEHVRRFYASLVSTGGGMHEAFVRGRRILISKKILLVLLGGADNPEEYTYPSRDPLALVPNDVLIARLAPDHVWAGETFPTRLMPESHRLIHLVAVNSLIPTQTKSVLRSKQAHFLYHLLDPNAIISLPSLVLQHMLNAAYCEKGSTTLPYARLVSRICRDARCEVLASNKRARLPSPLDDDAIERTLGKDYWERKKLWMREQMTAGVQFDFDDPLLDVQQGPAPVQHPLGIFRELGARVDVMQGEFAVFRQKSEQRFLEFRDAYERDFLMMARAQMDLFAHLRGGEAAVPPYLYDLYPPRDPNEPGSSHRRLTNLRNCCWAVLF